MTHLRIHPSIGFARVGTSEDFYLAPETPASLPQDGDSTVDGGLPIKPGTESDTITSADLRDVHGALKRQAARFHIFAYDDTDSDVYPNRGGEPIWIGSRMGDRTVADIIWQVHVANKKANTYQLEYPSSGDTTVIANYENGLPPLRNPSEGDPADPDRVRKLTIDPGPRTICGRDAGPVRFDRQTTATFVRQSSATVVALPDYPASFPADTFDTLYCPSGGIETLGELRTDERGRLLVVGAFGRACAWFRPDGSPFPLGADVDNDGWFDDTADGPVEALVVFDDGSTLSAGTAWVVSTDPAYAPQTINVVSLWDDIFDTWVRKLELLPDLFTVGYNRDYEPSFPDQIQPIFKAAAVQEFNSYLPDLATKAHRAVGQITADQPAHDTVLAGLLYIRNPNNPAEGDIGVPLMPLSLGDSGKPFLSPTLTQYFFLEQWDNGRVSSGRLGLGPGEKLDFASLFNCLGGRFSPGIDMTFVVRQPDIWQRDWGTSRRGPFRIRPRHLDYAALLDARPDAPDEPARRPPFLSEGYVPIHANDDGLEPGDTSKFMAIPWHTDYNSCATHPTAPNPANSTTLFWSWPAQRPVSVYVAADVDKTSGALPLQRYSLRGPGTSSPNPAAMGRYQERVEILANWSRIGTVIQGTAIAPEHGGPFERSWLLEVASQLEQEDGEPAARPWPLNATPGTQ